MRSKNPRTNFASFRNRTDDSLGLKIYYNPIIRKIFVLVSVSEPVFVASFILGFFLTTAESVRGKFIAGIVSLRNNEDNSAEDFLHR